MLSASQCCAETRWSPAVNVTYTSLCFKHSIGQQSQPTVKQSAHVKWNKCWHKIYKQQLLLQPFYGPLDFVRDYLNAPVPERYNQSGFTGARDSEWQWHQLGHMQICTSLQSRQITMPASHHSVFTGQYWHVLRKEDNDWGRKYTEDEVEGFRPRGRPKRTWKEVMQKHCQAHKLDTEDAVDRSTLWSIKNETLLFSR